MIQKILPTYSRCCRVSDLFLRRLLLVRKYQPWPCSHPGCHSPDLFGQMVRNGFHDEEVVLVHTRSTDGSGSKVNLLKVMCTFLTTKLIFKVATRLLTIK